MAGHKRIHSVAYTAGQDLSAYQYRVVSIAADAEVDPTESGNTPPLGVLLNKPNAQGTEAEVAIEGSDVKLVAAAAINEGELVLASAGGMGTPGPSGGTAVGTTCRYLYTGRIGFRCDRWCTPAPVLLRESVGGVKQRIKVFDGGGLCPVTSQT